MPVDPSAPIELEGDEGIVVFRTNTSLPIESILWTGTLVSRPIAKGQTLHYLRVAAGDYTWQNVRIDQSSGFGGLYRIDPGTMPQEGELDFSVTPGRMSYIGDLVIKSGKQTTSFRRTRIVRQSYIFVRIRNRIAGVLREIERSHPHLLDRFEFVHGGGSDDPFLSYYLEQRKEERTRALPVSTQISPRESGATQ